MTPLDVAHNIRKRAEQRAAGVDSQADPPLKTALVVQGGALRAIASCAACAALNRLGLTNAFDRIYGGSSGSINAAYFLTGQATLGITVYHEDVNNRRFFDPLRWRRMMNLEYLFEDIIQGSKRHDLATMKAHPTELEVITTDAETADTVWHSSRDEGVDFYQALKAACALPLAYPYGVQIGDRRLIDGMIKEPIPCLTAIEQDFTDILVLLTRNPAKRYLGREPLSSRLVISPLLRCSLAPPVYDFYRDRRQIFNHTADLVAAGEVVNRRGQRVRLAAIGCDSSADLGRFERNASKLLRVGYSAWRNTLEFFGATERTGEEHFLAEQEDAKRENARRAAWYRR